MTGSANLLRRSISSIVTLLIGLFVFVSIPSQIVLFEDASATPVSARTLPYLISSAIIIISLIIIISNIFAARKETKENDSAEQPQDNTSYARVFYAFVAIALWIVLLPYLGFNIATILLVSTIMLIIGNCRWWQIAILSLILSVPMNYLLATALRVYLPSMSLFT